MKIKYITIIAYCMTCLFYTYGFAALSTRQAGELEIEFKNASKARKLEIINTLQNNGYKHIASRLAVPIQQQEIKELRAQTQQLTKEITQQKKAPQAPALTDKEIEQKIGTALAEQRIKLDREIAVAQDENAKLRIEAQKCGNKNKELEAAVQRFEAAREAEAEGQPATTTMREENKRLQSNLQDLKNKNDDLTKKNEDLEKKLKALATEQGTKSDAVAQLFRNENDNLKKTNKEFSEKMDALRADNKRQWEELQNTKQQLNACQLAQQAAQKEIETLKQQPAQKSSWLPWSSGSTAPASGTQEEVAHLKQQLHQAQQEKAEIETQLQELMSELSVLGHEVDISIKQAKKQEAQSEETLQEMYPGGMI